GGLGEEAQVLWYAPLAYALVLGLAGAAGGAVLAVLPMERGEIRGWTASLAWIALGVAPALVIALFRIRRDVFAEQMPPASWLLALAGAAGALAVVLFLFGPRLLGGRAGRLVAPLPALVLAALVGGGGALAARAIAPPPAAPAAPPAVPPALAERPNVLLIVIDTLRADVLSCYGGPVEAPNMCGLGEEGTRFKGFAHASWTKPSFATLLSSTLPSTHGAMSKTAAVPEGVELVSETLQAHGYVTGGIVSNINLAPSFGFEQGWNEYRYLAPDYLFGASESSSKTILYQIARKVSLRLKPGHRVSDYYQDAEAVNAVALPWLERHAGARWFLLLHYMDPHDPYFAHPYDGTAIARVEAEHPDPALAPRMRALYEGEVRWTDQHLGVVFDRLRALGLWDQTMIVLTSDHGEEFHEHGGWWHGKTLYEDQIHVPFLVKWPRGVAGPPDADGEIVRHIDVVPTILARAGAPLSSSLQGVDLLARPLAERSEAERTLYAEEDHEGNVLEAVRTRDWKLIEANPGNPRGLPPAELFAIETDPHERTNLIDAHAAVADELRRHGAAHRQLAASRAVAGGAAADIDREECERLRVLGYVERCE
ncbi:MAG TPA: sulfatase, partial [Myxococcota bacterium]